MKRLFDPEAIVAQIDNLLEDRDRIDKAIEALRAALQSVEGAGAGGGQSEFTIDWKASSTTLHDAVRRACLNLKDGITRQRVISEIERDHPFLKPKPSSVAGALINLARGENPMLNVAMEGKGRAPSLYSIHGNTAHKLSADEAKELFDEATTRGSGGWQSLFGTLQKSYDKSEGTITLTPELRARLFHYYRSYGVGGWQDSVRRIFRRELPHLFI